MTSLEAWMDLLCCALPKGRQAGPVVVWHEAQRVWPLLEATDTTLWVHGQQRLLRDYSTTPRRLPMLRDRLALDTDIDDIRRLQQRARLCIMVVPQTEATARQFEPFLVERQRQGGDWLVLGPASRDAWSRWHQALPASQAAPTEVGPLRVMGSVRVMQALQQLGLTALGLGPTLAQKLRALAPGSLGLHLDLAAAPNPLLRLRPDPVGFIAALSDAIGHHIAVENRALFNQRGIGSVVLPWDGRLSVRLLLRNVRDRIDDGIVAAGGRWLPVAHLDYTDKGAIVTLHVPPFAPGSDAVVHVCLPRPAVPPDGFCDIGAVEFLVELA